MYRKGNAVKKICCVLFAALLCCSTVCAAATGGNADAPGQPPTEAEAVYVSPDALTHDGYTLDRVVVLSQHNIRSPLTGEDWEAGKLTPHEWFAWTSPASQLSVRGGVLETCMGQYFRIWLEREGLFPENIVRRRGKSGSMPIPGSGRSQLPGSSPQGFSRLLTRRSNTMRSLTGRIRCSPIS